MPDAIKLALGGSPGKSYGPLGSYVEMLMPQLQPMHACSSFTAAARSVLRAGHMPFSGTTHLPV